MWARYVNSELAEGEFEERIDHRRHKDRGLIEQPTIHEGVIAIAMDRKGYISERCEINRQILVVVKRNRKKKDDREER